MTTQSHTINKLLNYSSLRTQNRLSEIRWDPKNPVQKQLTQELSPIHVFFLLILLLFSHPNSGSSLRKRTTNGSQIIHAYTSEQTNQIRQRIPQQQQQQQNHHSDIFAGRRRIFYLNRSLDHKSPAQQREERGGSRLKLQEALLLLS